jgi:hypothetical protein
MKGLAIRTGRFVSATAVALLIGVSSLSAPVFAYVAPAPGTAPNEADLSNHNTYTNRDGNTVHSPARSLSGSAPQGATARCRDGTYSFSRHRSGTCSRHGGVADWL